MKILLLLNLFISLILATGTLEHNPEPTYNPNSGWKQSEVSEAYMEFAVQLYSAVSKRSAEPPPNLFFSPLSIYTTLSMLALGARTSTRVEILEGMGLDASKTNQELHGSFKKYLLGATQQMKDVKFKLGHEIFLDRSAAVFPQYQQNASYYYNTSIRTVSFSDPRSAEKTINALVSDRTNNKIQNLVKKLDPKTLLLLLDYSVFQGKWESKFDPENTEEEIFEVDGKDPILVPMMFRSGSYKTYRDKELSCNVVEVPYTGKVALLLIVPQPGDLRKVEQKLTTQRIKKYFESLSTSVIDLYIPKMSFNAPLKVKNAILNMGISSIFSGDNADFSRIAKKARLRVSDFVHQSYTSITEGGTEVSSATASNFTFLYKNPQFKADHPFITLIYHKPTQTILWMGRVKDPSQQSTSH